MSQHRPRRPVPQSELLARLRSHAAETSAPLAIETKSEQATKIPAPPRIRSDGWTVPRQQAFLKVLAATGSVNQAAAAAGMSPQTAHRLRQHPGATAFRAAWESALVGCVAHVRDTVFDRAMNGVSTPVFKNGEYQGDKVIQSERMMMFVLRNYDNYHVAWSKPAPEARFANQIEALVELPAEDQPFIVDSAGAD